jgi:hypothetical protein
MMVNGDYIRLYTYILIDGDVLFIIFPMADGRNVGKHQSANPIFASQDHGFPDFPVFFREAKPAGASWIILDHLGSSWITIPRVVTLSKMKCCTETIDPSNEDDSLAISPYLAIARLPENDRHIIYVLYIYVCIAIHITGIYILLTYP